MKDEFDTESDVQTLAELVLREGLTDAFRERARELSAELSPEDIEPLISLLHSPPPEPPVYDAAQHGLGGWLSACQFAVFELLYNLGETALPAIRRIAWGAYDWTQGNAIELLIRFAANGIRTDEIVAEVKARFPDIRYEAQLYAVEPLVSRLELEPALAAVFGELAKCWAFNEAVREVTTPR